MASNSKRRQSVLNIETKFKVLNHIAKEESGASLAQSDSYRVVRTTIRVLSYSTTAAQENQRLCSEKTSDEAHFWLNGYVNKQNCRIWSEANPQVYVETPLHPEKLTVWCALWAGGILLQKR
ncbi:hypothetical protein TNCV_2200291 [Trichonephila clavipes]|nr:hypothetical protein TNCV_2200291 [Trichonephila clavipes]